MNQQPKPKWVPEVAAVLTEQDVHDHHEFDTAGDRDEAADLHAVLDDIADERERQNTKWGEQNHPDGTRPDAAPLEAIDGQTRVPLGDALGVELAQCATRATDERAKVGMVTWRDILLEEVFEALAEADTTALRAELVQVAAVATQWVEAIDRRPVNFATKETDR